MSDNATLWDGPVVVRRSGSIVVSDGDAEIFLAFSAQVREAAISCSNLLSCYNAAELAPIRLPASIANFAPVERPFDVVKSIELRKLFKPATWIGLSGFARFLADSRNELESLLTIQHRTGGVTKSDVSRALETATAAACFAKITLKDLVAIHRRLFREFDVAELSYHANMLDDVLQGKSPLLRDGKLIPVKTDFELRDPRVRLDAEAWVAGSDHGQTIMVRNISPGGLGFDGAPFVDAGQLVEIRLAMSGRRLSGRIAWKVGAKAGVEFTDRLHPTDALLIIPAP